MIPYSQHTNRKKDESFSQYKVINKKMTLVKEIVCGVNNCKNRVLYPTIVSENNITRFTNGTISTLTTAAGLRLFATNQRSLFIYIPLLDKLGEKGSIEFNRVRLFGKRGISNKDTSLKVGIYKLNAAVAFDSSEYNNSSNVSLIAMSSEVPMDDNTLNGGNGQPYDITLSDIKLEAVDTTSGEQNYYFLGIEAIVDNGNISDPNDQVPIGVIGSANVRTSNFYDLVYYSNDALSNTEMGTPGPTPIVGIPYYVLLNV